MDQLKKRVLDQAIKMLDGLKVKYHIIDEDGTVYGSPPEKKRKRPLKYPMGTLQNFIRESMGDFPEVGEIKQFDCGEFGTNIIQSCVAAKANKIYGSGAVTTSIDNKNNTIKVYRVF